MKEKRMEVCSHATALKPFSNFASALEYLTSVQLYLSPESHGEVWSKRREGREFTQRFFRTFVPKTNPMKCKIQNANITRFDNGILRRFRLLSIDPVIGKKTNGHKCRRSIGTDRCWDHERPMMKITHPCARHCATRSTIRILCWSRKKLIRQYQSTKSN